MFSIAYMNLSQDNTLNRSSHLKRELVSDLSVVSVHSWMLSILDIYFAKSKSTLFLLQVFVPPNSALSLSVFQIYNLSSSSFANNQDNSTNSTSDEDLIIETENVTFYVYIR